MENPQYASVVIGEHEGWGSGFAASKTQEILLKTQQLMMKKQPLPPSPKR